MLERCSDKFKKLRKNEKIIKIAGQNWQKPTHLLFKINENPKKKKLIKTSIFIVFFTICMRNIVMCRDLNVQIIFMANGQMTLMK